MGIWYTDIIVVVVNSTLSYTQTPTIMHVLILRLYVHKIIYSCSLRVAITLEHDYSDYCSVFSKAIFHLTYIILYMFHNSPVVLCHWISVLQ